MLRPEIIDRFVSKTKKDGACIVWTGGRHYRRGYGQLGFDGKTHTASRIAYEIFVGNIPDGLHVLHHCDNPPCVRPTHLYAGTPKQNMQDRERRGRRIPAAGEKHGCSKLTAEQVRSIRAEYRRNDPKHSLRVLAKKYKVDMTLISLIIRGKIWRTVK